jgi:hypothetical protein
MKGITSLRGRGKPANGAVKTTNDDLGALLSMKA